MPSAALVAFPFAHSPGARPVLRQVAAGVRVHESEVLQTNTVVVHGDGGVLIIDAGILADEMGGIADELRRGGEAVLAGFSTHPHWDHLLWHAELGTAPRFGTLRCAAFIEARLADASGGAPSRG